MSVAVSVDATGDASFARLLQLTVLCHPGIVAFLRELLGGGARRTARGGQTSDERSQAPIKSQSAPSGGHPAGVTAKPTNRDKTLQMEVRV